MNLIKTYSSFNTKNNYLANTKYKYNLDLCFRPAFNIIFVYFWIN